MASQKWEYIGADVDNVQQLSAELNRLDGDGYQEIVAIQLGVGTSARCAVIMKRRIHTQAVATVRRGS